MVVGASSPLSASESLGAARRSASSRSIGADPVVTAVVVAAGRRLVISNAANAAAPKTSQSHHRTPSGTHGGRAGYANEPCARSVPGGWRSARYPTERRRPRAGESDRQVGRRRGNHSRNLSGHRTAGRGNSWSDAATAGGRRVTAREDRTPFPEEPPWPSAPPRPRRPTGSPTATSARSDDDQAKMLAALGLRARSTTWWPRRAGGDPLAPSRSTCRRPRTEAEALADLRALADRNQVVTSLIGLGYHDTDHAGVILRNVLENPAWYTAYTPYQPEISQGRLEALLNFQTMVADLTGMDSPTPRCSTRRTAAAEAMTLLHRRASKARRDAVFLVDADCHPQTIEVVRDPGRAARASRSSSADLADGLPADERVRRARCSTRARRAGSSTRRRVDRRGPRRRRARGRRRRPAGARACSAPPARWAPTCVVGSSQRFGVPARLRRAPRRLHGRPRRPTSARCPAGSSGVSVDADGRPAYRLALQTREQHIRREKATSQHLHRAGAAGGHGRRCTPCTTAPTASRAIAAARPPARRRARRRAAARRRRRRRRRTSSTPSPSAVPGRADAVRGRGRSAGGINLRLVDADTVGIALDETTTARRPSTRSGRVRRRRPSVDAARRVGARRPSRRRCAAHDAVPHPPGVPPAPLRDGDAALPAPPGRPDLALDRSMIPLGSCTMKLNATTEMDAVTWPEFGAHPPLRPARPGRRATAQLIGELEALAGRDHRLRRGVAPAQRRFAGRVRRPAGHPRPTTAASGDAAPRRLPHPVVGPRHQRRQRRDGRHAGGGRGLRRRTATSTSTTSRAKVDEHADRPRRADGHLPVDPRRVRGGHRRDLRRRARRTAARCTSTAPTSTPWSAWPSPGRSAPTSSHLNLHKTFCIPHGGGGPGVGPVAVRRAPRAVPAQPPARRRGRAGHRRRARSPAAPWGSAGILPIPWAYIRMMGADGPRARPPQVAILQRQLHRPPPRAALPGALHRRERPGRPRVHPRPPADHQGRRA